MFIIAGFTALLYGEQFSPEHGNAIQAIEKINDQALLAKIAQNDVDLYMRVTTVRLFLNKNSKTPINTG